MAPFHKNDEDIELAVEMVKRSFPEVQDNDRRRHHSLTQEDIEKLDELIRLRLSRAGCSLGLNDATIELLTKLRVENLEVINNMPLGYVKKLPVIAEAHARATKLAAILLGMVTAAIATYWKDFIKFMNKYAQ